ncbi:MAG: zinc ribbon domain-containing protein [Candidatus Helarchaeota archaeon]
MKCPNCGRTIEKGWNFCRYCRYDLRNNKKVEPNIKKSTRKKICPKCGTPNDINNKYCLRCGNKFAISQDIVSKNEETENLPKIMDSNEPLTATPEIDEHQPVSEKPEKVEKVELPPIVKSSVQIKQESDKLETTIKKHPQESIGPTENLQDEENFEYINWIKNHGLKTINEIKEQIFDNCDTLNSFLFEILSEIREYSEWTAPDPINDKKFLSIYGHDIELYASSIDCKKFKDKVRCKSIIQTFINSLHEAITQLMALI